MDISKLLVSSAVGLVAAMFTAVMGWFHVHYRTFETPAMREAVAFWIIASVLTFFLITSWVYLKGPR